MASLKRGTEIASFGGAEIITCKCMILQHNILSRLVQCFVRTCLIHTQDRTAETIFSNYNILLWLGVELGSVYFCDDEFAVFIVKWLNGGTKFSKTLSNSQCCQTNGTVLMPTLGNHTKDHSHTLRK